MLYHLPDDSALIAVNWLTGERLEFPPLVGAEILWWRDDGSYTLLWLDNELWLLSIPNHSLTRVPVSVALTASYNPPRIIGSPLYNLAALVTTDQQLQILDMASGQIITVSEDDPVQQFSWQADGLSLAFQTATSIYLYEHGNGTRHLADFALMDWNRGFVSPNGRYVAVSRVTPLSILDTLSREMVSFIPSSGVSVSVTQYDWHENSEWVLSSENTSTAGGGGGPTANNVLKADGSYRRELNRGYPTAIGLNWLPDRVIPYLAPGNSTSVIQQPILTLEHDGFVDQVLWYPDNQHLISHSWVWGDYACTRVYGWDIGQMIPRRIANIPVAGCDIEPIPEERFNILGRNGYIPRLNVAHPVYSPDRTRIADYNAENDQFEIRDTTSGQILLLVPSPGQSRIIWSANNEYIAFIACETTLWHVPSRTQIVLEDYNVGCTWDIAFSPDSRLLVWASQWEKMMVWNTATGEKITSLNWFAEAVDFSPDGTRLAAAGTWAVTIWDMPDLYPEE
jgi:WD40 repeat protein